MTSLEASLGASGFRPRSRPRSTGVVQEALTNVVKHAGATRVSIVSRRATTTGRLRRSTTTAGASTAADVREDALGLLGMRERLALVGGTLEVESSPASGTTIAAQVPLDRATPRR